jgi:hypothetical protein
LNDHGMPAIHSSSTAQTSSKITSSHMSQSINCRDLEGCSPSVSSVKDLCWSDTRWSTFQIWMGWLRGGENHNVQNG